MDFSRSIYADHAGGDTSTHAHLSDQAFFQAIVEFEVALTNAAEEVGYIDSGAAQAARKAVNDFVLDPHTVVEISQASAAGANPAIPIAARLKTLAGDNSAGVHVGATSQDAIDTALVLCTRRAAGAIDVMLASVEDLLADLSLAHRGTPIMGRTLGQQALPTTFGVITAGWLQAINQAGAQLREVAAALPVQYGGATGNLVSTYPHSLEIHDALARQLELSHRPLIWHSDRLPLAGVGTSAAQLAGAVRKIAGDIVGYCATEISELAESSPGGSSSMPHKANPAAAVACDGYARRAPGLSATLLDALDCRWQRGVGSWHSEWQTLRELLATTASAVSRLHASLDGIDVHTENMAHNMALTGNDPITASMGHSGEIIDMIMAGLKTRKH